MAVLGGAASVLTPYVFPLLPAILALSDGEGRRHVWGTVVGPMSPTRADRAARAAQGID